MSRLILILGDQLALDISSMRDLDKERDTILMCEVMAEATYVGHHEKNCLHLLGHASLRR